MIRRLFTAACAVSLLMCLGTATLWARGNRFDQSLTWCRKSDRFTLRCVRGLVGVGRFTPANPEPDERVPFWDQTPLAAGTETDLEWAISDEPSGSKSVTYRLGCHFSRETVTGDIPRWAAAPAPIAVIFMGVLPALWCAVTLATGPKKGSAPRRS